MSRHAHAHRWIILAAAIAIQACLGGVYAWSTFVPTLTGAYGLSSAQAQSVFGVTIATFTLTMVVAGRWLPRVGPRTLALLSGALFAAGYLLAAHTGGAYLGLLLGIGVIAGMGIGCGYACPLAVGVRWFPERQGLITGLAVAGFGGGGIVLSLLTEHVLATGMALPTWFAGIGLGYGAVIALAGLLLRFPPAAASATCLDAPASMPNRRQFWAMIVGMGCGTFAGLLVVGNLLPIGRNWGLPAAAAIAVPLFAAGNAAGRIGWGALADRHGPQRIIGWNLLLGAAVLLCWPLAALAGPIAFLVATVLIAFSFGGCFVLFAAKTARLCGPTGLATVYPWVFLAYGGAALLGPAVGGWLRDLTGHYTAAIFVAAAVCAGGALGYARLSRSPAPSPEPAHLRAHAG